MGDEKPVYKTRHRDRRKDFGESQRIQSILPSSFFSFKGRTSYGVGPKVLGQEKLGVEGKKKTDKKPNAEVVFYNK